MTRSDLLSQLSVLLGGRSAEEIAFDGISTGAQNDLMRATDIARAMVTEFGMSDALGVVNYDGHRQPSFIENPFDGSGATPEETALKIDTEIKRILTEAHEEARQILRDHRDILDRLSARLLEKEVIEADEFRRSWEPPHRSIPTLCRSNFLPSSDGVLGTQPGQPPISTFRQNSVRTRLCLKRQSYCV